MDKQAHRTPYEAPETELIEVVVRWNLLNDPSQTQTGNGGIDDMGEDEYPWP